MENLAEITPAVSNIAFVPCGATSIALHEAMAANCDEDKSATLVVQLGFPIHFTKEVIEINFQKVTYVFVKSYVIKIDSRHMLAFFDFIVFVLCYFLNGI